MERWLMSVDRVGGRRPDTEPTLRDRFVVIAMKGTHKIFLTWSMPNSVIAVLGVCCAWCVL
jgi:hypothetical protein